MVAAQPEDKVDATIDMNMMCLKMGLIFLLLFVSQWFKFYSLNLAGDRKGKVGSSFENMLVSVSSNSTIDRFLHICTNFWLICQYMEVFPAKIGLPTELGNLALPMAGLRCLILLIELRLACARIIDLDVEDRKKLLMEESKGAKNSRK